MPPRDPKKPRRKRNVSATVALLRARRRAQGMCAEAGCDQQSGDRFRCKRHAAKSAKRVKRHRQRQREQARANGG